MSGFSRGIPRDVALMLIAGVLVAGWYLIGLPGGFARHLLANLFFMTFTAVTAVLCWRTARSLGASGRPWLLVGCGAAAWWVASVIWSLYELVLRTPIPFPSLADIGYLLFYPFCAAGLLLAARQYRSGGLPTVEVLLDSVLVLCAATILSYQFLLQPVLDGPMPSGLALAVGLAWQAGTFCLLFLNLGALMWCDSRSLRAPLLGLMTGIAAFSIANVIYGTQALSGSYSTGDRVDIGWHAGFLIIGIAAIVARRDAALPIRTPIQPDQLGSLLPRTIALVASVLMAAGLAAYAALQPGTNRQIAFAIAVVGVVVAVRLSVAAARAQQLAHRTHERDRLALEAAAAVELARTNDALRDAETRYRMLVEHLPAVVYTAAIDAESSNHYVSQRQLDLTGYTAEEWLADRELWLTVMHPEDRERVLAEIARTNVSGESTTLEYRQRRRDGEWIWVRDESVLVRDAQGEPRYWQGVKVDITAQKRIEAELARERDLLHALMESVPDLVYFKDLESRFVRLNEPTARAIGFDDPAAVIGKSDADLFPDGVAWVAEEQRILQEGQPQVDRLVEHVAPTGERRWFLNNKAPIRDCFGAIIGLVGIGRDITERMRLEEQLAHQAFHDSLTGLPNRASYLRRLQAALDGGHQPAMILLDLDGFKAVNDSLGHGAGDELLCQVADRLHAAIRPVDLLARLGGDEFAVLVDAPGESGTATVVAERLLASLRDPFSLSGRDAHIAASAGIAIALPNAGGAKDALRDADMALYEAKRRGRNRWQYFHAEIGARVAQQHQLENELRAGIERGELELHYQPIVALEDRRVHGFEALVRWRNPERGLLLPGQFIELAEETGMIVPLGEWVLEEACRQGAAWRALQPDHPLVISINVSPRQFRDNALSYALWRALGATGFPPDRLILEVTEAALEGDRDEAMAFLNAVKSIGGRIALDDFGVGYSSLGRLHALPLDELKIDRSFISRLGQDAHTDAIVRAICSLGHELGLVVTAEGIETAEQWRRVGRLGCDRGQGMHIAMPMPAEDATHFLTRFPHGAGWLASGQ